MTFGKMLFIPLAALFLLSSVTVVKAADFDWIQNLHVRAEADASGFRSSLATRFNIGDVQINAVLSQVDRLGDAYMVLRLGKCRGNHSTLSLLNIAPKKARLGRFGKKPRDQARLKGVSRSEAR